ncbi:MAG: hypothetical protein SFW09_17760 [Hyphomicrobiaceae bacterium]|nr:hypothetical protein [Hyphomicrobiaceae bacterium]
MPTRSGFALALATTLAGVPELAAHAHTFDVKQLEVTAGEVEAGLDNTLQRGVPHERGSDIVRHAYEQGIDYGALPWLKVSAVMKLEKPEQDEPRANTLAVESIVVLKPVSDQRTFDVGVGWFTGVEASMHSKTTNSALFGPILTLKADKLSFTANPFLERTFGRNHEEGIALNYGWHAKYELRDGLAIGIEGFGVVDNLGHAPPLEQQEHRIGPAVFTELALARDVKITPDLGLLFGLTRGTPDVALKLNVGVPLRSPAGNGG